MEGVKPASAGSQRVLHLTGALLMLLGAADLAAALYSFRSEHPYLSLLGVFSMAGGCAVWKTPPDKARYWAVLCGLILGVVVSFHVLLRLAVGESLALPDSLEGLDLPRLAVNTLYLLAALWVLVAFSARAFPAPRTGFGRIADALVKWPALAFVLGVLSLSPMLGLVAALNTDDQRQEIVEASGLALAPDDIKVIRYRKSCTRGECTKTATFVILSEDPPREATISWRLSGTSNSRGE